MNQKRERMLSGMILAAISVLCFAACGGKHMGKNAADGIVDGIYRLQVPGEEGDGTLYRIGFDKGTMTYVQDLVVSEQTYTLDSGSYTVENGEIHTFSETDDIHSLTYLTDGDYILAKEYLYEGEIPDEDTFAAVCVLGGKETAGQVTFYEDGTYECIRPQEDGSGDASGMVNSSGRYERDGTFIRLTDEEGKELLPYYVYQGRITNSYFVKEK